MNYTTFFLLLSFSLALAGRQFSSQSKTSRPVIFFLDSSGERNEPYYLTRCAVESAAHHNPNHQVIVYSNGFATQSWADISPNIQVLPFEPLSWMENEPTLAPMKAWYESKAAHEGFVLNNIADAVRLVLLYLHGGTYFDTDVLSIKPLSHFNLGGHSSRQNIVAWQYEPEDLKALPFEEELQINVATLINFQPFLPFLRTMMKSFVQEFSPNQWGFQGPGLITRVYKNIGTHANKNERRDITLLEKDTVNLVGWNQVNQFFWDVRVGSKGEQLLAKIQRESTLVHVWGSQIGKQLPFIQNNDILSHLYSMACPISYEKYFLNRPSPPFPANLFKNEIAATTTAETTETIETNRLHQIILNNTKIVMLYPTIGMQLKGGNELFNMLFRTKLELDAQVVFGKLNRANGTLTTLQSSKLVDEMNRYLQDDVVLCFGIPNEMKRCRSTTLESNFGHTLQSGYHTIYAWLETKKITHTSKLVASTVVSSPTSMMAVTSVVVDFQQFKIFEQQNIHVQLKGKSHNNIPRKIMNSVSNGVHK